MMLLWCWYLQEESINGVITISTIDLLYASRIYIGDSFESGEMLYYNSYSLILLEGKFIYRDHVSGIDNVIKFFLMLK